MPSSALRLQALRRGHQRRIRLKLIGMVLLLTSPVVRGSLAEDLAIPARVQADLVTSSRHTIETYPRAQAQRWWLRSSEARRRGFGQSRKQIEEALKDAPSIAGLPHEELMVPCRTRNSWSSCASRARSRFGTSLRAWRWTSPRSQRPWRAEPPDRGERPNYVAKGAVLGFELVSGRPKLIINLAQAQRQDVAFRAEVLKLMRVVQ